MPEEEKKTSNTGAIAGGVVGGVAGVALIGVLIWWVLRRKRRTASTAHEVGGEAMEPKEMDSTPKMASDVPKQQSTPPSELPQKPMELPVPMDPVELDGASQVGRHTP